MKPNSFPQEEIFLLELNRVVDTHLSDSNLTVKRILRIIGMSRTDLHRKLNRSVGMSTTEYVRYLRLKKAARLLSKHPNWSIYQIAAEVDFKDQGYFTKRFKDIFKCCPLAYKRRCLQFKI